MNSISEGAKGLFNTSVRFLNQPMVKEAVKNIAGTATFAFGLVEIYDVYQISRGRATISTEDCLGLPKWLQVANKVVNVCAKISLILSAGVSRPGVYIISSIVGRIFSTEQLNRVFGPNTIFAVNPWHPRHVVSVAAVVFALPSAAQSTCQGINWAYKKIRHCHDNTPAPTLPADRKESTWLTDAKIRLMTLFNTTTSRPVLHIGNQLGNQLGRFHFA